MLQKLEPLRVTFPYVVFTDGAAKGRNGHGPASSGFVVRDRERIIYSFATAIGVRTNNYAEYQGLVLALNWVLKEIPAGMRYVQFVTDSELMANQLNGKYAIKSVSIQSHFDTVMALLNRLDAYKVSHVLRSFNKEADAVCNAALASVSGTFERDDRKLVSA